MKKILNHFVSPNRLLAFIDMITTDALVVTVDEASNCQ